ncbi:MAG TPA: hypothetical protein VK932_13370 [Kofleriaceae bacterium]|nr:hypothetical protein [Kofleriaceae bacterium]
MRIPVWLTVAVAILVILFGAHRIRLSFRSEDEGGRPRKGLYAMSRRTHRVIGAVYLLLGAALLGATFGWNPFGDLFGPATEVPAKDEAPTSTTIPIDGLPPPKKP